MDRSPRAGDVSDNTNSRPDGATAAPAPTDDTTMLRPTRLWVPAVGLLAVLGSARADTYYVVVFGAESKPQRPKYSHSWATFVHVPGGCPCGPPVPDAGPAEWF